MSFRANKIFIKIFLCFCLELCVVSYKDFECFCQALVLGIQVLSVFSEWKNTYFALANCKIAHILQNWTVLLQISWYLLNIHCVPDTSSSVGYVNNEQGLLLNTKKTKHKPCIMVFVLLHSVDGEEDLCACSSLSLECSSIPALFI